MNSTTNEKKRVSGQPHACHKTPGSENCLKALMAAVHNTGRKMCPAPVVCAQAQLHVEGFSDFLTRAYNNMVTRNNR